MTGSGDDRTSSPRSSIRALLRSAVVSVIVGAALLMGLSAATAAPRTSGRGETVLSSHKSVLGWQLVVEVDGQKLSLYVSANGKRSCYGRCPKVWLPLFARGKVVVVANRSCHRGACDIHRKWLGTIKRKGGALQVTYLGQPLYRYYKDKKTGQAQGQAKDKFGGPWATIMTDGGWSCKGLGCSY